MRKRGKRGREERNTNKKCEIESVAAVDNTPGPNSSGDPLGNHVKHSSESSLERMEEGYLLDEHSFPGMFLPSATPIHIHTHTSETLPPTVDKFPRCQLEKAGKNTADIEDSG